MLPNLSAISDNFIRSQPMHILLALNGPTGPHEQPAGQTLTASGQAKHTDPESKMAANMERMRLNPVKYPEAEDDRMEVLHPVRVAGGVSGVSQKVWSFARATHGLELTEPIACYDMETVGMGGHVTG